MKDTTNFSLDPNSQLSVPSSQPLAPIKTSVPGSIMLLGEHAVLHGYDAVVCAIDRRMTATLSLQQNRLIIIKSALGEYQVLLDDIKIEKPFQFVLTAIKLLQEKIPSGFILNIQSEFSEKVGLGSSAAVTVATLSALHQWLFGSIDKEKIYQESLQVIRSVQGVGSGADVAASVYGGIVDYNPSLKKIQNLKYFPEICLIYSGYKTPTAEVIKIVEDAAATDPKKFEKLYAKINECVLQGIEAIQQQDWKRLGDVFNQHQKLQDQLGVNDDRMQAIIDRLLKIKTILGAKISGSGLGDCVVALGHVPDDVFIDERINVKIEARGIYDKN